MPMLGVERVATRGDSPGPGTVKPKPPDELGAILAFAGCHPPDSGRHPIVYGFA